MTYYFIVPCGGQKQPVAAPAGELYTGSLFRYIFNAAQVEAEATRRDLGANVKVLILSAEHGLLDPSQVVAPYDTKMGAAGCIGTAELLAQATVRGISYGDEVFTFLPNAYREALAKALAELDVTVQSVYEQVRGNGDMRRVGATLVRHADEAWAA